MSKLFSFIGGENMNGKGWEWPFPLLDLVIIFLANSSTSIPPSKKKKKMLDYHLKQSKKFVKNQRANRNLGKKVLIAFILVTLAFLAFYLLIWRRFSGNNNIAHDDYIVFLPKQDENSNVIVQEIICPKAAELCFQVEDYMTHNGRKYQRRMMVETVNEIVLTVADLIPNPGEIFTAENAKRWPILKSRLTLSYTKGVVGQMFATGCIQLDKKTRTLVLGLGGAGIPNFIGELDGEHEIVSIELEPAVEYIAHKWFSLEKSSSKQKVIIQDGIEYINNWQMNVGQFDCIIVDACDNKLEVDSKYPLICPIHAMVNNEKILKKMLAMFTANGALLINTFAIENESTSEAVAEERQFILELFRHHFGSCYYVDVAHNKILTCTRAPANEPMNDKKYMERMKQLPNWLQNELNVHVNILDQVWKAPKSEI